jgi:hypothetical protein
LKLIFLFFAGIFQLTPPSLPLAYPPPPRYPFTPPRSGRKSAKITAPELFRGGVSFIQFQYFNQDLHRQQEN